MEQVDEATSAPLSKKRKTGGKTGLAKASKPTTLVGVTRPKRGIRKNTATREPLDGDGSVIAIEDDTDDIEEDVAQDDDTEGDDPVGGIVVGDKAVGDEDNGRATNSEDDAECVTDEPIDGK